MYVITDKSNVIFALSPTLDYQSNGNPLVQSSQGGTYAIAKILVGDISENIEVPDEVDVQTHMWVNGEFLENPNYIPPPPSQEEIFNFVIGVMEGYEGVVDAE